VDVNGADVTAPFLAGAQAALALARTHDCGFALLADGSPSCGSRFIYDGSFAGNRHAGAGVTAALLRQHGIEVFADTEIDALLERLAQQG
ncbi:purine-nucleoside phosphorylase, partial [Burkholderia ubonensis]